MTKPGGYVIYAGPSMLDGAPIVAIATMKTDNRKTGDMVQTWILREDMPPVEASKAKADASICGDCKHRWSLGGACYVNIGQGPGSVWRAYKRGAYPDATQGVSFVGASRRVRLGAYGDPAAVPVSVWRELVRYAVGHTGYTHQWKLPVANELQSLCMASVDNDAEFKQARAVGWRTFRVTDSLDMNEREFECAATAREGVTCADCMACDGNQRGVKQASVAILVHGSLASRFNKQGATQ